MVRAARGNGRADGVVARQQHPLACRPAAEWPAKVLLHHEMKRLQEWAVENWEGVLGKVDVGIGAEDRVAESDGARDVMPLLRPHEEHVARPQTPGRQACVLVPQ